MLTAVLSTWVLLVTMVMPGRAPLVHEAASFATEEACQAFTQQLRATYAEHERTVQARLAAPGRALPPPQRTYVCEERH